MTWLRRFASVALLATTLASCDGDSDDNVTYLHGTAATGAPLAAAFIDLSCNGSQTFTTTADAQGAWQLAVPAGALPCVVQAMSADGRVSLYSATQNGMPAQTLNVTTLTSLVVAHAAGAVPDTDWFTSLGNESRTALDARVPAAIDALRHALEQQGYGAATAFNPLSDALLAAAGDAHDELLESLALGTARNADSWRTVLNRFAQGGPLPAPGFSIAVTAARRSTGSLRVSNPETAYTFAPRSGEFQVHTTAEHTVYTFQRSNAAPYAQGFSEQAERLTVTVDALGAVQRVVYDRQEGRELAYLPVICEAAACVGVELLRSGNQVEIIFNNLHWPAWLTHLDGSLVGYAEGAVWHPTDLPGAGSSQPGSVSGELTGIAFTPETASVAAEAEDVRYLSFSGKSGTAGASLTVTIRDGTVQRVRLLIAESLSPLQIRAYAYECRQRAELANNLVIPACTGVTLSADGLEVTFDNTAFQATFGASEQPVHISGTLHAGG